MGKPLMIQESDDQQIEDLKHKLKVLTKIDVVRAGLQLLVKEVERQERVRRWQKAVALVSKTSADANREFQRGSRLHRL